ncbi:IS66 family insertion sequence element accessory protein TnpB [Paenirhodobacter sp.]|uniref:IS66 family insertion sequence element accessory protein TnpB n=1 Tax=Paenirhodobacter sp. TaxID=1965326 RepID=UPI003B50DF82
MSQPIDFRKGMDSLLALVRDSGSDPFSWALYVFRTEHAGRIWIVWWVSHRGALAVVACSRSRHGTVPHWVLSHEPMKGAIHEGDYHGRARSGQERVPSACR